MKYIPASEVERLWKAIPPSSMSWIVRESLVAVLGHLLASAVELPDCVCDPKYSATDDACPACHPVPDDKLREMQMEERVAGVLVDCGLHVHHYDISAMARDIVAALCKENT
jgi:hypothetical protein